MFIQGSEIDKKYNGSLEHRIMLIKEAIEDAYNGSPVNIIATHDKYAYAIDGDGNVLKAKYNIKNGSISDIKVKPSKDIDTMEDSDIPRFISSTIRQVVEDAMNDKKIKRTQVREIVQLLDPEEDYWLVDILGKINESMDDSDWYNMYEANQEKIRTTLYGSIRNIESKFPKTKFSSIPDRKINKFESEIKESISNIVNLIKYNIDECSKMVFNERHGEFFGPICTSLIVEAQAVVGLLGKAEKLMREDDMSRVAVAHDRIAERVKTMAVVTEYLKNKSQHSKNEE